MTAIRESNGRFNEFRWIDVVEGGHLNGNVVTADFLDVSSCE